MEQATGAKQRLKLLEKETQRMEEYLESLRVPPSQVAKFVSVCLLLWGIEPLLVEGTWEPLLGLQTTK